MFLRGTSAHFHVYLTRSTCASAVLVRTSTYFFLPLELNAMYKVEIHARLREIQGDEISPQPSYSLQLDEKITPRGYLQP